MKNKIKPIILSTIFIILTVLDIGLTYYNTPDLAMEANPLIAVWGFGWPTLIMVNVVTVAVFCFLAYFSFYKYKTPKIVATDEKDLKHRLETVSGKGSFIAMLGYSLCYSLIFSRLIVVMEWLAITLRARKFIKLMRKVPVSRLDLYVAIAITLVLAIIWLTREEKTKKKLATIETTQESYGIEEEE